MCGMCKTSRPSVHRPHSSSALLTAAVVAADISSNLRPHVHHVLTTGSKLWGILLPEAPNYTQTSARLQSNDFQRSSSDDEWLNALRWLVFEQADMTNRRIKLICSILISSSVMRKRLLEKTKCINTEQYQCSGWWLQLRKKKKRKGNYISRHALLITLTFKQFLSPLSSS